jgi:hypothetical protein
VCQVPVGRHSVEAVTLRSSVNAPLGLYLRSMHAFRSTLRGERRELSEENDRTDHCKAGSADQNCG